jgi:hypothetical protein
MYRGEMPGLPLVYRIAALGALRFRAEAIRPLSRSRERARVRGFSGRPLTRAHIDQLGDLSHGER